MFMNKRWFKFLKSTFRLVVLAVLVWLISRHVSSSDLRDVMSSIRWVFVFPMLASMCLVPAAMAFRLGIMIDKPGGALVGCLFKSFFFNNLFPAQIGGDIYKIFCLNRQGLESPTAIAGVAGDRILGISGLLLFSTLNLLLGSAYFSDTRIYYAVGLYIAALFLLLGAIFFLPDWILQLVPLPKLSDRLIGIKSQARYILKTHFARGLALTFIAYGWLILVNIFAMAALNIEVHVIASLLYVPVISVAVITLPISFNGLGVRESLCILFFAMAGYTHEEGLALAILNLFSILFVSLIGGLWLLLSRDNLSAKAQRPQKKSE